MTEKERAKQLAEEHWGYVKVTLCVHGVDDEVLQVVQHHYLTAAVHFHFHGVEDERNGMFRPKIGVPLTTGEIAAIAGPCSDCLDSFTCGGHVRKADGICLYQRPREAK